MQKLFGSILFYFVVNCCVSFSTNGNINEDFLHFNLEWIIKSDTTANYQLIKVDSFNLNIITPSSGVQFYKDGIVFLSQSKYIAKMVPIHISFGVKQAYFATVKDSLLAAPEVFSSSFAFPYPCDAISFNSDFDTMYFTKRGEDDKSEKIYQAIYSSAGKIRGSWIDLPKPMDFCNENSVYTHPSISTDGKILIFASDKTGSLGGLDLFITRKEGEKWSAPENMGESINTKTNELFPFLDSENNLYFSSEGHQGFGGYDVYMSKFSGKNWEKPVNLTKTINTLNDDIAFTMNRKDGKLAFFTTIEKAEKRRIQLYKVTLNNQVKSDNLINISDVLYTMTQSGKTLTDKIVAEVIEPEAKKEEVKVLETTFKPVTLPDKKSVIESEPKAKPAEAKAETVKSAITAPAESKDEVIYRVQILSSIKPQGNNPILINGKSYSTFQYFYLKEYRHTIGEFSTLSSARDFQSIVRKSGYPQAFVVVFKNNVRSTDPQLFK